ncbi:MAG: hypothetical protein JWO98_167 [Frankiales bacterium]|nr:hypothetical protein [Frankiales bacterium]
MPSDPQPSVGVDGGDLCTAASLAAHYTFLSERAIRSLYETGRLGRYKIGRRVYISERELMALLSSSRQDPSR